jgi:hypothetical protein
VLSPRMESATPMPEGIAIRAPVDKHGRTILSREAACKGGGCIGALGAYVSFYAARVEK